MQRDRGTRSKLRSKSFRRCVINAHGIYEITAFDLELDASGADRGCDPTGDLKETRRRALETFVSLALSPAVECWTRLVDPPPKASKRASSGCVL